MTRVTSEGSSGTRYVNPRRSKGTSCLDGIENVHWVFLLTVYILTLAGPDSFLRALVSIGRGGLDLRDFGVYSFLLSSNFISAASPMRKQHNMDPLSGRLHPDEPPFPG